MIEPYVLVRLKTATRTTRAGGRSLRHEGPYGNLHALPLAEALRLVDGGEAKLLGHMSLRILREQVEACAS